MTITAKGLDGIIVGDTKLSQVNGEEGKLIYAGYDIDQVAHLSFEEVCHLFLFGSLANTAQKEALKQNLNNRYGIAQKITDFICENPLNQNPMSTLRTAVSMLSTFRKEPDIANEAELKDCALDLIAKTSSITAAIARVRQGQSPIKAKPNFSFAQNFLYMSTGQECNENLVKTMDTALVLHMDHGFNASTFTARVVTSSLSDMISAVVAAIGSLKGPLHGGANTAVMNMLMEIGSIENIDPWLDNALSSKRKIMGFGHRVYKTVDPRAKHLKKMSQEWGEKTGQQKWFLMSQKLESLMFEKKGLNANVDFYSASTYYTMGIQPDMYTPIFAVARMVGWCAHIMEQLKDNRIMRPKSNYIGEINKIL